MLNNIVLTQLQVNTNSTGGISPEIIGKVAPLFGDSDNMIIFTAVIFGLGMRTVYRYYEEKKKGNPDAQVFDTKFLWTALTAFILAGLPAMSLMPSATATFNSFVGQWGIVFAWIFTALGIYSANAGINALAKSFEERSVTQFVQSGKMDKVIQRRLDTLSMNQVHREENPTPTRTEESDGSTTESTT